EPHGHGDVLQDGAYRSDEESAAEVEQVRYRAGADRALRTGARAHLRGADQLQRPHVRRGQEDQLEGWCRGVLAHLPVERARPASAGLRPGDRGGPRSRSPGRESGRAPARADGRGRRSALVRVLVTGAGGLLGEEVVRTLARRGHEALPYVRAQLDITDERAVAATLERELPDAVLHCAAFTAVDRAECEPDLAFAVNATGTAHVARACARTGARF